MLQACRITRINQHTYMEERHPSLSVLPGILTRSSVTSCRAAGDVDNGKSNLSLGRRQLASGARLLAGVCISAQICSVSSSFFVSVPGGKQSDLSEVESIAWCGILTSYTRYPHSSAPFMFSLSHFVTPVFFPLSFLLRILISGSAVKGLKIFWGKVPPFGCSVRGITSVWQFMVLGLAVSFL